MKTSLSKIVCVTLWVFLAAIASHAQPQRATLSDVFEGTNDTKYITAADLSAAGVVPSVYISMTSTGALVRLTNALILPTGLMLNGVVKSNWSTERIPLTLVNLGAGAGFNAEKTKSTDFQKPSLAHGVDRSKNFANYVGVVPADLDTNYSPNIIAVMSRSGANGNAVLQFQFAQGSAFPGLFACPVLSTNTYTGTGARAVAVSSGTGWILDGGSIITVQVARDGNNPADTLTVPVVPESVLLEIRRR